MLSTRAPHEEHRAWTTHARCAETIASLRAHARELRVGVSPYEVTVALGRIAHGDVAIRAIENEICPHTCGLETVSVTYEILSLVGPLLSLQESVLGDVASADFFEDDAWSTIDLRTGRVVELPELVAGPPVEVVPHRYLLEEIGGAAEITGRATVAEVVRALARLDIEVRGFAIVR